MGGHSYHGHSQFLLSLENRNSFYISQIKCSKLDSFYGASSPNSGKKSLDVFSCDNSRRQRLVPIDLLKLDDEGAVITAIR